MGVQLHDTATHVAGPVAKVGKRKIQRCVVCGEKLADTANEEMRGFWREGELVQGSNGFLRSSGDFLASKHPPDLCIELVET